MNPALAFAMIVVSGLIFFVTPGVLLVALVPESAPVVIPIQMLVGMAGGLAIFVTCSEWSDRHDRTLAPDGLPRMSVNAATPTPDTSPATTTAPSTASRTKTAKCSAPAADTTRGTKVPTPVTPSP